MAKSNNTMNHKFLRDNKWEDVMPEVWRWEAHYDSGDILKQFGDDGIFHQFSDIDQNRLASFKMTSDDRQPITLMFEPEKMKLIHYYKRVRLNMGTEDETFFTAYCFGYETKTLGRVNKVNIMLLPTGETIITEDANLIDFK